MQIADLQALVRARAHQLGEGRLRLRVLLIGHTIGTTAAWADTEAAAVADSANQYDAAPYSPVPSGKAKRRGCPAPMGAALRCT